jgi:hypothetical protein
MPTSAGSKSFQSVITKLELGNKVELELDDEADLMTRRKSGSPSPKMGEGVGG